MGFRLVALLLVLALFSISTLGCGLLGFGGDGDSEDSLEMDMIQFSDDVPTPEPEEEVALALSIDPNILVEIHFLYNFQVRLEGLRQVVRDLHSMLDYSGPGDIDLDWVAEVHEVTRESDDYFKVLTSPDRIVSCALDLRTYIESEDPEVARMFILSFVKRVEVLGTEAIIHYKMPLPQDVTGGTKTTDTVKIAKNGDRQESWLSPTPAGKDVGRIARCIRLARSSSCWISSSRSRDSVAVLHAMRFSRALSMVIRKSSKSSGLVMKSKAPRFIAFRIFFMSP